MKFLILGDLHGEWANLNITIARALKTDPDITHIVQVGDFAYGWNGTKPHKFSRAYFTDDQIDRLKNEIQCLWLDGNHENYTKLLADGGDWQPNWKYQPRGSVLEVEGYRMMFFGGATSVDIHRRTEGESWWPEESITYGQVHRAMDTEEGPLDAIFSHEHPAAVPYSDIRYKNTTGKGDKDLLEAIRKNYHPDFWFFGHHHAEDRGKVGSTEWFCCPIIDSRKYIIWTGATATTYWD